MGIGYTNSAAPLPLPPSSLLTPPHPPPLPPPPPPSRVRPDRDPPSPPPPPPPPTPTPPAPTSLMFGVEWFMKELGVPNLSLNAAAGFAAVLTSPVHTAGSADLEFGFEASTTGLGFLTSNFGFRYYFF